MADDGVVAVGGRVHSAVVDVKREFKVWVLNQKRIERGAEMHSAEGDGAAMRKGPAISPRRSDISSAAASISWAMRRARSKGLAAFGQGELPGGPLKKQAAQRLF